MSNLIKNISWVTFGDIATKGSGFFATIYLARVLGIEGYGLIGVALSIYGYAEWIADMGLQKIGTREIARAQEKREFHFIEIFTTRFFLGVLVFLLSFLVLQFVHIEEKTLAIIQLFLVILIAHNLKIEWYFNGKQEYRAIAFGSILGKTIFLILVFSLIQHAEDIIWVPYLYIVSNLISALFLLFSYLTKKNHSIELRHIKVNPQLIKKGVRIGFGGFFAQTVQLLPPLIIGIMLNFDQAGLYTAAFKVVLIAMIIDKTFVTLLIPSLSKQWSENKEKALANIEAGYRILLFAGFGISLFLAVFAEQIITVLFDEQYLGSIVLLRILSLFVAGTFVNSLFSFGLIAIKSDKAYFLSTFKGGLFASILIFSASFLHSVEWVAISVVLAEFGIMLFSLFAFQKEVKLPFFLSLIIVLIITRLSFYLSAYLEFHWLLTGILSLIFFVVTMIATKQISGSDFRWLKERITA